MLHRPRKFMRTAGIFSGLFLLSSIAPALALDPTGDWRVADGVANIRVAQCRQHVGRRGLGKTAGRS